MRSEEVLTLAIVVPDMKLSPNVGSDRSWVWNAAADVSEGEPEAQTLAIRFANADSEFMRLHLEICSTVTICRRGAIQGRIPQGSAGEREDLQRQRCQNGEAGVDVWTLDRHSDSSVAVTCGSPGWRHSRTSAAPGSRNP